MAKRNKKEQLVNRAKIMSFKPLVDDHVGNTNYQDKFLLEQRLLADACINYSNKQSYYRPPLPSLTHSSIRFNINQIFIKGLGTSSMAGTADSISAAKFAVPSRP